MDLLIVSGRRPDLLEKTLRSIQNNFDINFSNVIINIDPWAGNEEDHKLTTDVTLKYHPAAIINEPKEPNFCQAVKFLWTSVKSQYAFHTEDDWIWNQKLTEDFLIEGLTNAGMFRFVTEQNKGGNRYGTSPCVMTKDFAHEAGNALDITLDPEKQYDGRNKKLVKIAKKHNVVGMSSKGISAIDIGRNWRKERRIHKTLVHGKSIWTKE